MWLALFIRFRNFGECCTVGRLGSESGDIHGVFKITGWRIWSKEPQAQVRRVGHPTARARAKEEAETKAKSGRRAADSSGLPRFKLNPSARRAPNPSRKLG